MVFEAVDEASDDTQEKIITYVEKTMSGLPVVMTGRHETFKKSLAHFEGIVVRSGLDERQVMVYFQKSFPGQTNELKRMLLAETITPQLLESPYNCQEIGKLLLQGHTILRKGQKGPLTVTDLMVSIMESKLQFLKMQENHLLVKGISRLALWSILNEKVSFDTDALVKFGIIDDTFQNEFLQQSGFMNNARWTFVHEMFKEYLAAVAVVELQTNRDHIYRVLCSKLKYSGIVRFICGLLSERGEFEKILAHTKLLGEAKELEYEQKSGVLLVSKKKVKQVAEFIESEHVSRQSPLTWGPLIWIINVLITSIFSIYERLHPMEVNYQHECQRFLRGELTKVEEETILGGTNGILSIPDAITETFLQIYQCLHEVNLEGKEDCDVIRKLIGNGLV